MKVTVKVSLKKPTPDRHNMLITEEAQRSEKIS